MLTVGPKASFWLREAGERLLNRKDRVEVARLQREEERYCVDSWVNLMVVKMQQRLRLCRLPARLPRFLAASRASWISVAIHRGRSDFRGCIWCLQMPVAGDVKLPRNRATSR